MITCKKNDRLLELLWFVGYSIEFPTQLAVRIGGGAEWNRRVMYPAIFRVDRIADYRLLDQTFSLPYANRFQEGEFRKRVQFMYPGRLQSIRFRYTGASVDAILDRLPTAKVLSQDGKVFIVEAEVYGKGIVMWLLSQGDRVEVLAPESLRLAMKETLLRILEKYQEAL